MKKHLCTAVLLLGTALSLFAKPTEQERIIYEQQLLPAYQRGDWATVERLSKQLADNTKDWELQLAMRQLAAKSLTMRGIAAMQKCDGKTATRYLQQAADQGDTSALNIMGQMYYSGMGGVSIDRARGIALIQKAARLGDATAQQWCRQFRVGW